MMKPIRMTCVVGARPNFIKMSSLLREAAKRTRIEAQLVHTGQHYSPEMSEAFFRDLELPQPDVNLNVGGGSHTEATAQVMLKIEPVLAVRRPDLLLVVGDVNSTLASSLVAAKMGIRIAHVEAGLRSFDRAMPEEINRLVTDTLSDYLFASEPSGVKNLETEGYGKERVFFCGNVMIDTLLHHREKAARSGILRELGLESGQYAVATLHRPSNVDEAGQLKSLMDMMEQIARRIPVVFPVHPRTRQRLETIGVSPVGVRLISPLGYLDFLQLMSQSRLVLTDSGGIQEETTILQVPCLTLRDNTERPATIEQGTNQLVGSGAGRALAAAMEVLDRPPATEPRVPPLWDGRASERIFDHLERLLA